MFEDVDEAGMMESSETTAGCSLILDGVKTDEIR